MIVIRCRVHRVLLRSVGGPSASGTSGPQPRKEPEQNHHLGNMHEHRRHRGSRTVADEVTLKATPETAHGLHQGGPIGIYPFDIIIYQRVSPFLSRSDSTMPIVLMACQPTWGDAADVPQARSSSVGSRAARGPVRRFQRAPGPEDVVVCLGMSEDILDPPRLARPNCL